VDYDKTPTSTAASTQVFNQTHFGDYANLELIGRGGMAEVYKSIDPARGTPVAIKILPVHLAADPDFRIRFDREVQTVTKLQHAHIVRVFDHGEAVGTPYMVM
jgi:serine/threonine-protein kinase